MKMIDNLRILFAQKEKVVCQFISVGCILTAWDLLVVICNIPKYLLPRPSVVFRVIIDNYPSLFNDTVFTITEASAGFVLGSALAFITGSIFAHFRIIEKLFLPLFVALQSVPLIAIAPLIIIWTGNGYASKIFMSAIICFFPMVVTTSIGLQKISQEADELMVMLNANIWQRYVLLRLPCSVPYIVAGLKVNASLAIIGAIVSELSGAGKGIGYQILMSSYKTDTPALFAAILFASLSGLVFYKAVEFVGNTIEKRYE